MSTEKQKSKSTIITITVLSVLLALAVTATIVLAAFQATKNAKTTIVFGSGITITVSGVYNNGSADTAGSTGSNLIWGNSADPTHALPTVNDVTSPVTMDAISITCNTSPDEEGIYLIAKANIEGASVTVTPESGWTSVGSQGWYVYGTAIDSPTAVAVDGTANFIAADSVVIPADNNTAGQSVTASFAVFAVNAGADDAIPTLTTRIATA